MTKLALLISKMEGFGIPGKVPTTHHNPGDLRHSPHSTHLPGSPEGIGIIDTDEHGWLDLERQLGLYAERGMTLRQCIEQYAPSTENDTTNYLSFVSEELGVSPDTKLREVVGILA